MSSDRSSTADTEAIVEKAGVATRPVSILRRVSGESPAESATSSIDREPRASRSNAPRRRPRSRSAGLFGNLTMATMLLG